MVYHIPVGWDGHGEGETVDQKFRATLPHGPRRPMAMMLTTPLPTKGSAALQRPDSGLHSLNTISYIRAYEGIL